ncbi:phage tail tape measure protein [Glaesserella parasuis]|nr:phage tail tape measure protein [Glaesserella parasuis]MDD2155341.1 phage tail tape measure protein [Glaesserella parasuis]MDD2158292.1 phage tail tape measure protein [Glaesserella parasuis]MDE3953835.1 phage tail tape measure protein [Glaesserella parasuis]MDE3963101.1 phage tail tape measure protein [Glaesserella parasuis]MDE4006280.1 phage tail tape measure protein [Glaesserella parasuis]
MLLDIKDHYAGGEFLAKFIESHGLSEKELPKAADYLQRAMFASGLRKEQVYESMKYYAPKVNSLGLTGAENTEKILAIEGMAGVQGLEGSTFGTGFNMMLSRMNKGPKMMRAATKGMKAEAQDMVKAAGVSFEFWDKKGKFKGIDAMLTEMEKFEKIRAKFGDEGVGLVAEELFGIEGGRLADILAKKGKKGLEEMLTKMREQASLQDRIAEKNENSWCCFGSSWRCLG